MSNGEDIKNLADKLAAINTIKFELAALDLNPRLRRYYEFNVESLLATLLSLSTTSVNLATSVNNVAQSLKKSNIKDTVHLVQKLNKECEEVYKVLVCRIDELICIAENE